MKLRRKEKKNTEFYGRMKEAESKSKLINTKYVNCTEEK